MKKPGCQRQPRLVLSATDLALLIVMAALITAHLKAALAGSLVSLLFVAQHLAILILTLLHRPAGVACRSSGAILRMGRHAAPAGHAPDGCAGDTRRADLLIPGSLLATAAILSLGRSFGMSRPTVGCAPAGSTGSCATRSTPHTC